MTGTALFNWEKLTIIFQNPFTLSYGTTNSRDVFWLRMADDLGWGEAAIPPYYGIPFESMIAFWQKTVETKKDLPAASQEIASWVGKEGPAPARCALEIALYDRLAKQAGLPLYQFLGLPCPQPMPTSYTIAIAEPQEMARRASEASNYPIIKIKMGSDDDMIRLKAIRAARPDARLLIDANAGWTREQAFEYLPQLEANGLELIEQPLVKEDIEGLGLIQARTAIPIVADESLQSLKDLERLVAAGIKGVNLKLMKIGGFSTALEVIRKVKQYGLGLMLGQMMETSLGTTAMLHLSGEAQWLDLDSPKLITNDPFRGIIYDDHGNVHLPEGPGLAVKLVSKK